MSMTNVIKTKEQTYDNHTNEKQLSFAERILKKHGWKSGTNDLKANDNITQNLGIESQGDNGNCGCTG